MLLTFQKTLVFRDLSRVIQFLKVFCSLRELFPLDERIALVGDDVRSGAV